MCASAERRDLIEKEHPTLSVVKQAQLLDINRSSIYYKPVGTSPEKLTIKHRIDEIYTKHPYYGSRRITATLNREGFNINRKAVQRHMREIHWYLAAIVVPVLTFLASGELYSLMGGDVVEGFES